jgi:hypothetical protein
MMVICDTRLRTNKTTNADKILRSLRSIGRRHPDTGSGCDDDEKGKTMIVINDLLPAYQAALQARDLASRSMARFLDAPTTVVSFHTTFRSFGRQMKTDDAALPRERSMTWH